MQFFDRARNTQVTLRISPADGIAELLTGVDVRAPVGTLPVGTTDGDLVVNVRKVGSRLTASVTGSGTASVSTGTTTTRGQLMISKCGLTS